MRLSQVSSLLKQLAAKLDLADGVHELVVLFSGSPMTPLNSRIDKFGICDQAEIELHAKDNGTIEQLKIDLQVLYLRLQETADLQEFCGNAFHYHRAFDMILQILQLLTAVDCC